MSKDKKWREFWVNWYNPHSFDIDLYEVSNKPIEGTIHVIEKQAHTELLEQAEKLALCLQNYVNEDCEMGEIYIDAKETLTTWRKYREGEK